MVKVIETNLSYKDDELIDFQSRVIEVESWESYIEEVKENKCVDRKAYLGNLYGGLTVSAPLLKI